ncbi:MAG: DUF814 domain-containing protein [Candidatus Eisenbacteria bacterium]|nr:DUF814 domain-containing protein [Candidatus Eisenbacteria bacterium]
MDLLTCRRLASEWAERTRGARFGGLARLDPRRVALRLDRNRWALLLDEGCCGICPAAADALKGLPISLEYMDQALTGWQATGAAAEPGRLRLFGEVVSGPLEISLVGPPRPCLLLLSGDEVRAGHRRPSDRPWTSSLPTFAPGATEGPPGEEVLEGWIREHPEPLRDTALARLSLAFTVPVAREVRTRAGSDEPGAVARAAAEVLDEAAHGGRAWLHGPGARPAVVSGVRLTHLGVEPEPVPSVMEALERLDRAHLEPARLLVARRAAARGALQRQARAARALEKLSAEADEAGLVQRIERQAHTLLAHGAGLPRGTSLAELPDLEDPAATVAIELDPTRTGVENATEMLRRAARLARRSSMLAGRRAQVQAELEGAAAEAGRILDSAGWRDLDAMGVLEEERAGADAAGPRAGDAGAGRGGAGARGGGPPGARGGRAGDRGAGARGAGQPRAGRKGSDAREEGSGAGEVSRVVSEEGWAVLVGRNDRQNDFLTHKLARPGDLWFHAAHVPGSHVVLRRDSQPGDPSRHTLEEVAGYAAWMSKDRNSSRVSVLVAEKRHVRRARGGPGKVTVERAKTLIVRPRKPGGKQAPEAS